MAKKTSKKSKGSKSAKAAAKEAVQEELADIVDTESQSKPSGQKSEVFTVEDELAIAKFAKKWKGSQQPWKPVRTARSASKHHPVEGQVYHNADV